MTVALERPSAHMEAMNTLPASTPVVLMDLDWVASHCKDCEGSPRVGFRSDPCPGRGVRRTLFAPELEQEASMGTTKSDAKASISSAEAVLRHSVDRIESSLDRVTPRVRGLLDEVLAGLRHRLEALPSMGGSVGEAATKGTQRAEAATRAATARLAEAAEHLADAVSHAPVPASRKAVRAGQKAIAETARTASKELRTASGGSQPVGSALWGGAFLAAAAIAVLLVRRASRA